MSEPLAVGSTLGLAVLAVWWGVRVPGRADRDRLRQLGVVPAAAAPSNKHRWVTVGIALAAAALLGGLGLVFGARGLLFGSVGLAVSGTVAVLVRRRGRRVHALVGRTAVAQACSILAAQVRIGQVPSEALRSAAGDCPILLPACETVDIGGDPVECWRRQSGTPGLAGLADLGRAWLLSISTGAELASVLEEVAESLASDQALGLVITSEAAAPRATGKIMAVLPVVGIGLGYLMGGDPVTFLINTTVGGMCLAIGTFCACIGVLWMERIADRAMAV